MSDMVKITITGDSKNYQNAMRDAEQATDNFNDELKENESQAPKTGSKLADLGKKVGALAISYGLFKGAAMGLEYNATMEQYQTSFETMTGSVEKATDVVEQLKKKAAATPFEMPQLAETTQLLMNYGFTADDAVDKMSMLGDISQGNADKMNRVATAYGQMSSAGKVSLEDVKQMIEAGFNPLKEISESTGESMESLYDRISKGTISVDEITESMERSTSKGGKYFQAMDKQSNTLNGRMSTLKDTVQEKLGAAFQGLSDILRDNVIPFAIDLLNNWEKYEPIITPLAILIGALTVAYLANAAGITTLTGSTGIWAAVSGAATGVTTALGGAFTFLTSPIGLVILAIGAVIAIGYLLISHWDEVKAFALETWQNIENTFQQFDDFLTGIFSVDWTQSFGAFGEILNAFSSNAQNIWNGIKQIFSGIIDFVKNVFTGNWRGAWQSVIDIFGGIFNTIVEIVKSPINLVIGLINGMIAGVESGINFCIDGLNTLSFDVPDWVPLVGGEHWGFDVGHVGFGRIEYLLHGTDNWQGGFARMNEGGRGELTYLPNGTQVIPHDISVKYAKESARYNNVAYVESDSINYDKLTNSLVKALKNIKVVLDKDEVGSFVDDRMFKIVR